MIHQDGRILFMDPVTKGKKYMEFKASKDAVSMNLHYPFILLATHWNFYKMLLPDLIPEEINIILILE